MNNKSVVTLADKDILKRAQRTRNATQAMMCERLGMSSSALSQNMHRPKMSLGMFSKILDALDYDVVIADRETGNVLWKLEVERPDSYLDDDI